MPILNYSYLTADAAQQAKAALDQRDDVMSVNTATSARSPHGSHPGMHGAAHRLVVSVTTTAKTADITRIARSFD